MPDAKTKAKTNALLYYKKGNKDQVKFVNGVAVSASNPERERGSKPVVNELGLKEDVSATLPKSIISSLENLPQKTNRGTLNQEEYSQTQKGQETEEDTTTIPTENSPEDSPMFYLEPDNDEQTKPKEITVFPPIIMLFVTGVEYIGSAFLGIIAFIMTVIPPLTPVGMILGMAISAWKIAFGFFVFAWSYIYSKRTDSQISDAKKRIDNFIKAKDRISKAKRIEKFLPKTMYKGIRKYMPKAMLVGLSVFPIADVFFPADFILVLQSWREKRREVKKYNQSLKDLD